jgi:hypothetical protein
MPGLESKIAAWRDEMLAAHIPTGAVDELEAHLRDDITRQIRSGVDEKVAFDNSVRQLGCASELRAEFQKYGSLSRFANRAKNAMLSFAGIPNHYAFMNDPSLKLDSRWATYLRSALFLLPALVLWSIASVYVTPKFEELWGGAGTSNVVGLTKLIRFDLGVMHLLKDNTFWLTVFGVLALSLLEWRIQWWPRYRRAIFGVSIFIVNFAVLFSFAILFLAATFAASQFAMQAAK